MRRSDRIRRVRKIEKSLLAMTAAVAVAALMMGGTYAWKDFTQSKVNKFRGFTDADVTLHDEFDGINKDVFVENAGTSVIYVRIRLDEYMEIGGISFVPEAHVRNTGTWTPHTYDAAAVNDCGHGEAPDLFHSYYAWEMSGAQRTYLPGTPGLVYSKLGADGKVDPDPAGGWPTAAAAAPVRMTEYLSVPEMAAETGCWILDDTEDGAGWAYWSKPLFPGTATNLLLDSVTRTAKEPTNDWFYGIDVKLQAVTDNDFGKWAESGFTVSPAALQLIETWKALA